MDSIGFWFRKQGLGLRRLGHTAIRPHCVHVYTVHCVSVFGLCSRSKLKSTKSANHNTEIIQLVTGLRGGYVRWRPKIGDAFVS